MIADARSLSPVFFIACADNPSIRFIALFWIDNTAASVFCLAVVVTMTSSRAFDAGSNIELTITSSFSPTLISVIFLVSYPTNENSRK